MSKHRQSIALIRSRIEDGIRRLVRKHGVVVEPDDGEGRSDVIAFDFLNHARGAVFLTNEAGKEVALRAVRVADVGNDIELVRCEESEGVPIIDTTDEYSTDALNDLLESLKPA